MGDSDGVGSSPSKTWLTRDFTDTGTWEPGLLSTELPADTYTMSGLQEAGSKSCQSRKTKAQELAKSYLLCSIGQHTQVRFRNRTVSSSRWQEQLQSHIRSPSTTRWDMGFRYALPVKNLLSIHWGSSQREMGPGSGRGETGREGDRQTETQAKVLKPQLCPRNDFSAVENSHSISAEPEPVHDPHWWSVQC